MLETAFAQLRLVASVVLGIPFSARSLDRIVDGLLATQHEFGAIGAASSELIQGPTLDEATQRTMQLRRMRTQAQRAARQTDYYGDLFAKLGLDPKHLDDKALFNIPPTPKEALRDDPDAFVCRNAQPTFRTTTTGTTGRPTSVCFSSAEMHTFIAFGAIHQITHQLVNPADIALISTSARATLGNTCFAGTCMRIGAQVFMGGLIDPALTLAMLTEKRHLPGKKDRVSLLSIYPSYLGELVTTGLRLGYRPADFGVQRIFSGGEIVTEGLKRRSRALFGEVEFIEGYGITELWPMGGTVCSEGHLHFEPSHGMLEVHDPETGAAVEPGAAGTIVATPFPPFRNSTLVLRYDTQDVVRRLETGPTCELRNQPATSNLQGKLRLSVRHADGWTFPRQILEAVEATDEIPLPARCGFWASEEPASSGVIVEVLVPQANPTLRRTLGERLEEQSVPLHALHLVEERSQLRKPLPLRGDLREVSFV